jgi:5-hydroxyisourate hydrolase
MTGITTHVLDTARGRPASGVAVALALRTGNGWTELAAAQTAADGRVANLLPARVKEPLGTYRLRFDVGPYFAAQGVTAFFPYVEVVFQISGEEHYHVPLLVSPFGYATYRGS